MTEQIGNNTESNIAGSTEKTARRRIRISVRSLVEFILRKGDIDERIPAASEETMAEGTRMHRRLQKAAGAGYEAEVSLKTVYPLNELDEICVEGRADGIYYGAVPEKYRSGVPQPRDGETEPGTQVGEDALWSVDEIKTTWRNVRKMKRPSPVHLAQAKCYAFMYAQDHGLERVRVRMTYCGLDDESLKYFYREYTGEDLSVWFTELMENYRKWAEFSLEWTDLRDQTIHPLRLPFPWRKGQKELAVHVYHTICHQRKLFIEAPTGAGKTMAVLYPAIEALGQGKAQRIFYLTAKNVAGGVAEDTVELLRKSGLRMKNVTLTAKEKICPQENISCRPDRCPRARGHYDRVNKAVYDLLVSKDRLDRRQILACAEAYQVCPFELGLDLSFYADMIICDYNYVFDPHAYLRRFFGEGIRKGTAIFLIDEAHNLVDRGRDMYSAGLFRENIRHFRKKIKAVYPNLWKSLGKCLRAMKELEPDAGEFEIPEDVDALAGTVYEAHAVIRRILNRDRKRLIRQMEDAAEDGRIQEAFLTEKNGLTERPPETSRNLLFEREAENSSEDAAENGAESNSEKADVSVREELLSFYFDITHFLLIYEGLDEHYVTYSEFSGACHRIRLFCVDPGRKLRERMEQGASTILFSATLLPIRYYKQLLGGTKEDYEVYARSSFDPAHRGVFIADNVTSRYTARGPRLYVNIAEEIHRIVRCRRGNYLVFFPSYAFMREVDAAYEAGYSDGTGEEPALILQTESMSEEERKEFLRRFGERRGSTGIVGFCVLGGVFSEGIDLKEDALIGAVIVGTGIPQVSREREIMKSYFAEEGKNGFDYAYRFPGMNRVLQAAGRVIRTETDRGIVALLDERFTEAGYRTLFPAEWNRIGRIGGNNTEKNLQSFWSQRKDEQ